MRDASIAWLLGGTGTADALTAALRLPYMARRLFGEATLSLSLTTACTKEALRGGSGCGLALAVTRRLAVWTGVLLLLLVAGASGVMLVTAPGLLERPDILHEAVTLFRICAPYIWCAMLAAGGMAILHSRQHFFLPSLTTSLFNLCLLISAGLVLLFPACDAGTLLACGVLGGGMAQWLVMLPAVRRLHREDPPMPPAPALVTATLRRIPPGIFGAAMPQLAFLIASALASTFPEGQLAALFYAERLLEFPLGVLGAAVGMTAAPRLAALVAASPLSVAPKSSRDLAPALHDASHAPQPDVVAHSDDCIQTSLEDEGMALGEGEKATFLQKSAFSPSPNASLPLPSTAFSHEISRSLLLALGLNLPAAAGLAAVSVPLVTVTLGHGAFTSDMVADTALALCAYAPGLPAYAISRPLLAACHALENNVPLKAAGMALLVTLVSGLGLMPVLGKWGPPLGVSLGLWCNAVLLWHGIRREIPMSPAWRSLAVQAGGTLCTFGVAFVCCQMLATPLIQLAAAIPAGATAYACILLVGDKSLLRSLRSRHGSTPC